MSSSKHLVVGPSELRAVSALLPPARLTYAIKRIVDWGEAWGLKRQGTWAAQDSPDGQQAVCLWPAYAYAEAWEVDASGVGGVVRIPTESISKGLLDSRARLSPIVCVFPVPGEAGAFVDSSEFIQQLEDHRREWY